MIMPIRKPLVSAMLSIALIAPTTSVFAAGDAKSNQFWWPDKINLEQLRQHSPESNPLGDDFDYAEAFSKVDQKALKKDIEKLMTTSQDWWPADWGNYGPLFIRMAWHSAGTYRTMDGRGGADGGQQRFEPLNSWPDNANLDKARRLLWPVKQKYGRSVSWADLIILAGNVALENSGFKTLGFAGGRADDWEPDMVYWGAETVWMGDDKRYKDKKGKLENPLAAVQMGLIYVNPEGAAHKRHDPKAAAHDIRETFGRMAMNDEETLALIAGGHTLGKTHGAHGPEKCVGPEPAAADITEQGLGWINRCGKGNAEDTVTSGLEGAWTPTPTQWSQAFLANLLALEWVQVKSPAGAVQWIPKDEAMRKAVPDAHIRGKMNPVTMLTTDLSLREDPAYRKIAERFVKDADAFNEAFARAWFKLTHRDMGPSARYVGDEVPVDAMIWQDPVPKADHKLISEKDAAKLKAAIMDSGLSVSALVKTAWASAASFRDTDMRGGANGARLRLAPQKDWEVNDPKSLAKVLSKLESVQKDFNEDLSGGKKVSLADVIVAGGAAAIEKAAKDAGYKVTVPFRPGRTDASQAQTDIDSFAVLEPKADAFRNYYSKDSLRSPADMMVDRADTLDLTVPEMTVLMGGMRVLNANAGGSGHGVFTSRPGQLSNDFFVNLLDMSNKWVKSAKAEGIYEGRDRSTGKVKWTATPVDLAIGSSSELRAVAEVYASNDGKEKFVNDFVNAWSKVMTLDRFDLK